MTRCWVALMPRRQLKEADVKTTLTALIVPVLTIVTLTGGCPVSGDLLDLLPDEARDALQEHLDPDGRLELRIDCMDPAVVDMYAEVLSGDEHGGRIRITVVMANIGEQDFVSGEGQQAVYLMYGGQSVAIEEFVNLAANEAEEVVLTYEVDWSLSTEFQSNFEGVILYDPDIYIDGNEDNDDCVTDDNSAELLAEEINDMFTE